MTSAPHIPHDATVQQARELLEAHGWREVGVGDWSWTLADPEDRLAARLTPFDPAYRLHAKATLAGPANRWLPRIDAILPLAGHGYAVMMERLWPADTDRAAAFCAALGIANESGYASPADVPFPEADADLADLRRRVLALRDEGARRYRLWGGSDIRPGNVLADRRGGLKLVDPIFLRGPAILQAIEAGRADLLADFTGSQLAAFLTIRVFQPGPETEALRVKLAAMNLG